VIIKLVNLLKPLTTRYFTDEYDIMMMKLDTYTINNICLS